MKETKNGSETKSVRQDLGGRNHWHDNDSAGNWAKAGVILGIASGVSFLVFPPVTPILGAMAGVCAIKGISKAMSNMGH